MREGGASNQTAYRCAPSRLTLMRNPFGLLDCLGLGAQRHEVALDDVLRVGRVEPQGQRPREAVGAEDLLAGSRHADGLRERRRSRQRRKLGRKVAGRLALLHPARRAEMAIVRGGRDGTLGASRFVCSAPQPGVTENSQYSCCMCVSCNGSLSLGGLAHAHQGGV